MKFVIFKLLLIVSKLFLEEINLMTLTIEFSNGLLMFENL